MNSRGRILVAAPTHNVVDNVLRRFIEQDKCKTGGIIPIRVSTDIHKVADDLKSYTCDARMGKDLNIHFEARRRAQKHIKSCKIAFTACISVNLGLLRNERFEIVVVDEASQQTEPMTVVPLIKEWEKAILMGDHVQSRATTLQFSKTLDYDISLFERLHSVNGQAGITKVMLDTHYRMHRSICGFASAEFYDGKLKTAISDESRPVPVSKIQWPSRILFAQCSESEDLGLKSKQNRGQAMLCKQICDILLPSLKPSGQTIAILTPYTRQLDLLKTTIPGIEVSSIDGFQGREADIIVYVTVRCNMKRELGFLKDMRRLNVAVTRAKTGLIIIGDKETLTGREDESAGVWKRLLESTSEVTRHLESLRAGDA